MHAILKYIAMSDKHCCVVYVIHGSVLCHTFLMWVVIMLTLYVARLIMWQ